MPTASISSMKTMHWPPHLAASFFALRASQRTMIASMPMNVCANPEPGIEMNGQLPVEHAVGERERPDRWLDGTVDLRFDRQPSDVEHLPHAFAAKLESLVSGAERVP